MVWKGSYLGAELAHAVQVDHLSTCEAALFYLHCPGPEKPASQTFCTSLKKTFYTCVQHVNYEPITYSSMSDNVVILNVFCVFVFFVFYLGTVKYC